MLFGNRKNRSRKKEIHSTLQCLQFVDSENHAHYLFRAGNNGYKNSNTPLIDLRQISSEHGLTARGVIIRAPLEKGLHHSIRRE
jgi:hypothetical protein